MKNIYNPNLSVFHTKPSTLFYDVPSLLLGAIYVLVPYQGVAENENVVESSRHGIFSSIMLVLINFASTHHQK